MVTIVNMDVNRWEDSREKRRKCLVLLYRVASFELLVVLYIDMVWYHTTWYGMV